MSTHAAHGARRLTVCLILTVGGVAFGGPAPAATGPSIGVTPQETTLAQFTLMDIYVSSNWSAGGQVLVELRGTQVANGFTDANGSYQSGDVPVPAGVAVCGSDEVDWLSGGDFITSTNIAVYCPQVEATPNPVTLAGTAASFTVTGSGYPAGRLVTFTIDGSQTSFDYAYTDGNGAFTKSTTVPSVTCGQHKLTATGQPQIVPQWIRSGPVSTVPATPTLPASTTLTVVGCTSTPPPPSRGKPKITANPAVITDGMLTHVAGSGFVPNQPVALTWRTLAGATLSVCSPDADSAPPLNADAKGGIDVYCFARPHEVLGAAQLVAVQADAQAAAPVVIEGGSMQPSSGDQFVFRR